MASSLFLQQSAMAGAAPRAHIMSSQAGSVLPQASGLRIQRHVSLTRVPSSPSTTHKLTTKRAPTLLSVRAAVADVTQPASQDSSPSPPPPLVLDGSIFGPAREFSGTQALAKSIPAPLLLGARAALVLIGVGAGYLAGGRVVRQPAIAGQLAGAVILGSLGGAAGFALEQASQEAAATELHNFLASLPDPFQVHPSQVQAIAAQYGVSLENERFKKELADCYERLVWAVLPPGNDPLRGTEVDMISQFKAGLGLEDEDAAAVHIEIGRRIFRQRMETGDKGAAIEERKTFQKLVYVSDLVFGPKAKFLLPWKRIFKVSDAQVDVAVRTNAQELFQAKLEESRAEPDVAVLKELRAQQKKFKLPDEMAAEMFEAEARKRLQGFVSAAGDVLKARSRVKDMRKVMEALDGLRSYHRALSAAASSAPAGELVPGVGPLTVLGDASSDDRSMEDLRTLYKTYLSECLARSDRLEGSHVAALAELRNIFGMGKREAEECGEEVTKKAYRQKLANSVTSGALEAAASKAEFLQGLCDSLHFNPQLAAQIHEDIYRQKLQQCLEDGALSDEDVAALLRLRVLLCVPKSVEEKAHADICGSIFTKVVDDAIGAGVDGYDGDTRTAVQKAVKGLRLPVQAALDIASKAVRAIFLTYVRRARSAMSRTESARELKKMVIFSNLTVSQLLDDIKGEPAEAKKKEVGEGAASSTAASATEGEGSSAGEGAGEGATPKEAPAAAESKEEEEDDEGLDFDDKIPMIQSMRKTKGKQREGKAQKDINIGADLDIKERLDLYRTFLLFCLQGDTAGMPMGTALVVQKDTSDFVRLSQLGDILGLTPMQAASVHQSLAEQAFTNQAQTLLADGQLSKARAEQLKDMQKQLGLPDEAAQKVIQQITSTKMAGAIDTAVQQGRLTVDDIKGLKEAGVDIEKMVAKKVREQMFTKLVAKELEKGTGKFDADQVAALITDLGLEEAKGKSIVKEMATERLKGALVQAVSLLRQKKAKDSVATLFNLLACDEAEPAQGALSWPVKEELYDLYSLFLAEKEKEKEEKPSAEEATNGDAGQARPAQQRLKELLGIDDATAKNLQDMVASGGFSLDGAQEEKFVF